LSTKTEELYAKVMVAAISEWLYNIHVDWHSLQQQRLLKLS